MNIIKKLPEIFKNNIDKKINNNKEVYYSFINNNLDNENNLNDKNINDVIDELFNSDRVVYSIRVIISTNSKVYDTYLVARTSTYLLTIDEERILIKDIISLQIKNP